MGGRYHPAHTAITKLSLSPASYLSSSAKFRFRHRRLHNGSVSTSGSFLVYEQPDTFYTALADFLDDDKYALFKSSIIHDDGGLIKVRKMRLPQTSL